MTVNAPFYVKADDNRPGVLDKDMPLVPAKFLIGLDGQPICNPNPINNPINRLNGLYFDDKGHDLGDINQNNYLIAPINEDFQTLLTLAQDIDAIGKAGKQINMLREFQVEGEYNAQRTYMTVTGDKTFSGISVPMFQDYASFKLGVISELT